MTDEIFQANNPKQVKSRQDKAERQREQQKADLAALLKLPEFRRYIWRHMNETCGMMKDPDSGNGSIQSKNIGMANVARALFVEIESVDPLTIPQMMIDFHNDQKQAQ